MPGDKTYEAPIGAEALWGRESMAGMGNDPLMNASTGRITDATATGTITNHDALPGSD